VKRGRGEGGGGGGRGKGMALLAILEKRPALISSLEADRKELPYSCFCTCRCVQEHRSHESKPSLKDFMH
jgi:hypothetical protein